MGEHKRKGKTFFITTCYIPHHIQYAIHRAPSGHFTYLRYCDGVQMVKSERITQEEAAVIMSVSVPELLAKFKLD